MTQLDRAAQTIRPRSPLPLILGLIAVAIGVVIVFASGRRGEVPEPAGAVPAPVADDSMSGPAVPDVGDTQPTPAPSSRDPIRPVPPRDTATRVPRDTTDSARAPIGDPAALPRPRVTLPRPAPDSTGDRP